MSGPDAKNKICLSKIRSLWEKLRLFKVRLNPLASNSRATLARFVRTLQAYISAPSDPILLPHILFFASGSDLKKSSLSFFTEKFSSTWKVTSTETDILSNFLQRVSVQSSQPLHSSQVWDCVEAVSNTLNTQFLGLVYFLRRAVQQRCILSAGISGEESFELWALSFEQYSQYPIAGTCVLMCTKAQVCIFKTVALRAFSKSIFLDLE